MGAIAPAVLLDAIKWELEKRAAENSLLEFSKQAWHIIEPGTEFKSNWHLEAIAEHLEAVAEGEIPNLLINIPPGCCKSIFVSVMFPAWLWVVDPTSRVLNASYGEDLAVRDASKTRDIVTSEWFLERWPHVQIVKGQDQKTKYALTERGWRMATSVGGRATGEHPDYKIVDDPHNAKQAASDLERASALNWFDQTLSTRGVSRGAKTIVVMQRLHERDVSGHILADLEGYEHLCLPMRYEKATRCKPTKLGFEDPRTVEGALLWPEMFPEPVLKPLEQALGEYATAGQLQQRPAPIGGGILKTANIKLWPADKDLPLFDYILQSYDTAFTERTTADPTACTVYGVFTDEKRKSVMLLDSWAERMAYPKLRERIITDWKMKYGKHDQRADRALIEQKGSGISIIQDLQATNVMIAPYNPGKADKISRAHQVSPILEAGCIYIPESSANKGKHVSWAESLVNEMTLFPAAAHDDLVDTFTQATIYLRDLGMLDMDYHEEETSDEKDYSSLSWRNPYAS